MSNINNRPIFQKGQDKPKEKRKGIRKVSKKRAKRHASKAGQEDLEYLGRVKEECCCICGAPPPSDAHHTICGRYGSRKSPDSDAIPLCKNCHQNGPNAIHNGKRSWVERNGPDTEYIEQTKRKARYVAEFTIKAEMAVEIEMTITASTETEAREIFEAHICITAKLGDFEESAYEVSEESISDMIDIDIEQH